MIGYVPPELVAKYNSVSQEGKLVQGTFVSPELNKFSQMTREQQAELKKLDGAPMGDPSLDSVIGSKLGKLQTPFMCTGDDEDRYDSACMISSLDNIMSEVNFDDPMQDSLSKIPEHMLMSLASGEGAKGVMQPSGFSPETQAILDKQRQRIEKIQQAMPKQDRAQSSSTQGMTQGTTRGMTQGMSSMPDMS